MDAPKEYLNFIGSVKDRIRNAQYAALKAVNKELVGLYWDIGRMISEKQRELGWGKAVISKIARDLQNEFAGQKGFSERNLRSMVFFYHEFKDDSIWQTLSAKLSFSHNMAIKDHYTFDFLEISEKHSERELETALIKNIQQFLIELGGELAFIGNQYKLDVGGEEFFLDLLFYHRELQCLVVIELKTGKFKPEYQGKMEFYLNVLNDLHKKPNENDAVGIIVCRDKNRVIVEYSLKKSRNTIGISSYSTGPELPECYEKLLPSAEQIERGLGR